MKRSSASLLLGILLLTACTATPTTSPVDEGAPTDTPAAIKTLTPTPLIAEESIVVTSTSDSGPGTLRQALEDAQDKDRITFDPTVFPPDAPVTIYASSELPHIRVNNLTLDASNTGVILDGSQVSGDWVAGLQIVSSTENTIMGLQISHFPGPGIAISGDATDNLIGGDRSIGAGPFGQGNLLSNNVVGIDIAMAGAALNTVTGNLIGTDLEDSYWLGNERDGISIWEGAHDNTIGPNNIIANNGGLGVKIEQSETLQNIITENSIYDNGIDKGKVAGPVIFDFILSEGTVTGATCPYCSVEIFSTSSNEKEIFEDQTIADENGVFAFDKGAPFTGPYLLALTTDVYGNPGEFGWLTSGTEGSLVLQQGNNLPKKQFLSKYSNPLADNHIATQYDGISTSEDLTDLHIYNAGVTRARVSMAGLEPELVDWDKPELSISQAQDDHFNRMADKDIIVTYVLMFWDKETYPGGEGAPVNG